MNKEKAIVESGKLDAKGIADLKKRKNVHKVFEISVPLNDEGSEVAFAYLKKPSIMSIEASMAVGKNKPLKSNAIIITNNWLAGDERIKTAYEDDNAELLLSAAEQIDKIVEIRQATLKKR